MVGLALSLAAFPGVPIAMWIWWTRAALRYRAVLEQHDVYHPQDPFELLQRGPISAFERAAAEQTKGNALTDRGDLGNDAVQARRHERRAWYAMIASAPIGLLVAIGLPPIVPWLFSS